MIINSSSNRCVWWWTQHLESEDNDKVRLVTSQGLRADNIHDMLQEMVDLAAGTKCENPFYQMNFNPAPHEQLTEEQWDRVREIAEKKHGLEGQPYFMVMHTKYGREHPHFIYSRIDLENMKAISDSNDARKNHAIAREVEREFGLQKVVGPYDREPEAPRPKRAPKKWESYRAGQSGLRIEDIEAEVTELYQQSTNGRDFQAALDRRGYILAVGDRVVAGEPALMIIDIAGDDHSLSRRLGIKTKDLNAFMRDVDRAALPDIRQAQAMQQERKIASLEADRDTVKREIEWEEALAKAAIEKERREEKFLAPEDRESETRAGRQEKEWPVTPPQPPQEPERTSTDEVDHFREAGVEMAEPVRPEKPLKPIEKKLFGAYRSGPNREDLTAALDKHGLAFARVTADEAYQSDREAKFAKAVDRTAPVYREGEIVVVREPGLEYQRKGEWTSTRVQRIDQSHAEHYLKILDTDRSKLKGIEATKAALDASGEERAAYWRDIRLERATDLNGSAWTLAGKAARMMETGANTAAKIMDAAPRAVSAALDIGTEVSGMVFSLLALFDGEKSPRLQAQQNWEGEKATAESNAEAEERIDFAKYAGERAQQQRNAQEEQAARDRQREHERER